MPRLRKNLLFSSSPSSRPPSNLSFTSPTFSPSRRGEECDGLGTRSPSTIDPIEIVQVESFHVANHDLQEKRFRSMQEHIRRAHPNHYIPKLPATEESFLLMVNTPPDQRAQLSPPEPAPPRRRHGHHGHGQFQGSFPFSTLLAGRFYPPTSLTPTHRCGG